MRLPKWAATRLELLRWIFILAWRSSCDRWFIFRDAPDHVVLHFLSCAYHRDADMRAIGEQAVAELRLRNQLLDRELSLGRELSPAAAELAQMIIDDLGNKS